MLEKLALVMNSGMLNGQKFEGILRQMQRGGSLSVYC